MFFVHVCLKSVISGKLKLGIFVNRSHKAEKKISQKDSLP